MSYIKSRRFIHVGIFYKKKQISGWNMGFKRVYY